MRADDIRWHYDNNKILCNIKTYDVSGVNWFQFLVVHRNILIFNSPLISFENPHQHYNPTNIIFLFFFMLN